MTEEAVDVQVIRGLLQRAVVAGLAPGGVALVRTPEGESSVAVGLGRVLPAPHPASLELLYDLASLTKPLVTGTLFLLARREGLLALENTVAEVLDGAAGRPCGGLTMAQLLTHTSGLPSWLPLYALARGHVRHAMGALLETQPVGPPGSQVIYSCPGFILLGWILERVLDRPLEDAFRRLVARPLGLERELCYTPDPGLASLAGGAFDARVEEELLRSMEMEELVRYIPSQGDGLPDDGNTRFLGGVAGNAGLWGTARAVATLAAEYLPGGGKVLREDEAALAVRPLTNGLEQSRGLGWQLAATPGCSAGPSLPAQAFGHTGFTGTSVWVNPSDRSVYVFLTNRHHPAHRGVDLHPLRRRFHSLAPARARNL